METIMGLPYTSSGEFAAMWANTNTHVYFREGKMYYLGFALSESGEPVAVLWPEEKEVIVKL